MILVDYLWNDFKNYVTANNSTWLYVQESDGQNYSVYTPVGNKFMIKSYIRYNTADHTEFESTWKSQAKDLLGVDYDGRDIVHATSRYTGSTTVFSGAGDAQSSENDLWGSTGTKITLDHKSADPSPQSVYVDFNTVNNLTYVHSGFMQWKDAQLDDICCVMVPKVTTYSTSSNTNYTLFGGYLIIPAAGDGNISVNTADMKFVEVPLSESGTRNGAGYWDADYDPDTDSWSNIQANLTGGGRYNLFGLEVALGTYLNFWTMLGSGNHNLSSEDAAQIGHNMRLKFVFHTNGTAHDWQFAGNLRLFRKRF